MPFLGERHPYDLFTELYNLKWIEGFAVGLSCGIVLGVFIGRKN